jgi:hypothetical protein
MEYQTLRNDLLRKLEISRQALSQRAQRIKDKTPMTTKEAVCVIAQQENLRLEKYLDSEELARIRQIVSSFQHEVVANNSKKIKTLSDETIIIISGDFKGTDPLLDKTMLNQAKEMAVVYPLLYVLENSMRQFICLVMENAFDKNWWENEVSRTLREKADKNMNEENINSWHQRRGKRPIDYLDLMDLPKIFNSDIIKKTGKKIVPQMISSYEWFNQFINEIYKSRCVLCHMNPLDKTSINSIKVKFDQWQKHIKAKKDKFQ